MKNLRLSTVLIIIFIVLTNLVSFDSNASIGDITHYKGKVYTIKFEGSNYTVLLDKEGNRKIVNYKKR